MITSFKQIKEIVEPIPAERFIVGMYGQDLPVHCVLGHIHLHFTNGQSAWGDEDGYGAIPLSNQFFKEVHPELFEGNSNIDISVVNNYPTINGYTEPIIKDRVMHLIEDGIKWEESKIGTPI